MTHDSPDYPSDHDKARVDRFAIWLPHSYWSCVMQKALSVLVIGSRIADTGIAEALQHEGHLVKQARDVSHALVMVQQADRTDAVVLEGGFGDEAKFARELRDHWLKPAAVIVAVCYSGPLVDRMAAEPAFDVTLHLPVDAELMSGLLRHLRSLRLGAARPSRPSRGDAP